MLIDKSGYRYINHFPQMDDLIKAVKKLAYIIEVKQGTPTTEETKYKNALLLYYLKQIYSTIGEVSQKIGDIHDIVKQTETCHLNAYEELYNDTLKANRDHAKFYETFGPYMMLWQAYNNDTV